MYKTEICKWWVLGDCPFAEQCVFAHGASELRWRPVPLKYKTTTCRNFVATDGHCPYGYRCRFIHRFSDAPHHTEAPPLDAPRSG
jgi:butyrate response factor 1